MLLDMQIGFLPRFVGLLWAIVLTLALAVLCRFLPGGTGDRVGGVAVTPRGISARGG